MDPQQPLDSGQSSADQAGGGLTMHTLLNLPDERRMLLSWILRQNRSTLSQISHYLKQDQKTVKSLLQDLINLRFIETVSQGNEIYYKVNMVSMRSSRALRR